MALNTNASQLHGGAPLSVPCYPNGNNTFRYYGGSLAFGKVRMAWRYGSGGEVLEVAATCPCRVAESGCSECCQCTRCDRR